MTEQPLLPIATPAETRRALAALVAPHRVLALATFTLLVTSTALALCIPPILGAITETVVVGSTLQQVDALGVALLTVVVASAALSGSARVLMAGLGETLLATLREQVVDSALAMPLEQVELAGTGDLAARVGEDADIVSRAVRQGFPELIVAVLTIALTLAGLGLLDWRLALAGLAASPIQAAATRWYLRRAGPLYAAEREANSTRAQQITETIAGADTVRAFGLAPQRVQLAVQASAVALQRSLRAQRTGVRFFFGLNIAELVGLAATLAVGFLAVRAGIVNVGQATAAALYFHGLFNPIGALLTQLDTAQDATASLARLVGITQGPQPSTPAAPRAPLDTGIEVERVSFGYTAGHHVLHGISLAVEPGHRLAIVGASGAGKTTVAKLVAGIHRAQCGEIRVGGQTRDQLGPTAWQALVDLVTQEVHVFSGTIADNLRLGRADATASELDDALAAVGADRWVAALPDGVETRVGDSGHHLTVDHAQHLALARLWLGQAAIVVLDEATAEAGSAAARTLEAAASAAIRDRTAIVIAHRLTQAATADTIVVLDAGRVVEHGGHALLITAGGRYAELWNAWAARRRAPGADPANARGAQHLAR
jgi:ATP-binding cassette subfamily C protein